MTILPKKKPQQASGGAEGEAGESNTPSNHQHQMTMGALPMPTHLQAMLEDKIRATDYEATSEAIEEQVAHESYLQWLRENDQRSKGQRSPSSTSSSEAADRCPRGRSSPLHQTPPAEGSSDTSRSSPRSSQCSGELPRLPPRGATPTSPRGSSSSKDAPTPGPEHYPAVPGSSKDPMPSSSGHSVSIGDFTVNERASFLNHLPPHIFGSRAPVARRTICFASE
ncbi:OTU domain-containing protein 5 [Portunus trituberculatus]|uniref:OTU domain-containing protein 5 n=1 Tax=Portunus trituberculatus TaxID=210409 RepID=A0A5B7CFC5_PORTR|nr:OTU domain-containing protein 5 [Portunus trituberculatus]